MTSGRSRSPIATRALSIALVGTSLVGLAATAFPRELSITTASAG